MANIDMTQKVVYKDNFFVKLCPVDTSWGNIVKIEEISMFSFDVKVGDIVKKVFNDKQIHYNLIESADKNERIIDYKDICVVKKIDKNFMFLIQNNNKKIIKIPKDTNFKVNDVGYLDNNILKKDLSLYKFCPTNVSSKQDIKIKKSFVVKKYVVSYGYKNAVCLLNIEDFNDKIFEPTFKFNGNVSVGDLYYKVKIDQQEYFFIDEENYDTLFYYYKDIIKQKDFVDLNLSNSEQLDKYNKILQNQENIYKNLILENEKLNKYYKKNPPKNNSFKTIATYVLEEKEQYEDNIYFKAVLDESFDELYCDDIDVFDYDLPKYPRVGDAVKCVKDNNNQIKYFYFNNELKDNITKAIQQTKYYIKNCENSL